MQNQTLILNSLQIDQKINRLAWQLYEDNSGESELVLAGILSSGYAVAERLAAALKKISSLKITLVTVAINKHSHHDEEVVLSTGLDWLKDKTVVVVDDVLNSGKTMMYALRPFLSADLKKLRTVVLVDRNHKRYPVSADFAGLTLATTLQEHVSVVLDKTPEAVYMS
jgi:pyrimidine operon attenuation protein / uracil phosphoribosyltransferase